MSLEPVTGVNTINNILKLFKLKIPLDAPGVNGIAKFLIARELNMYFTRVRQRDVNLNFELLDEFTEEQIDLICFKRGVDIDQQSLKEKKDDLKLWLSISN